MNRRAVFSQCTRYRYTLWRDWSAELAPNGAQTRHFTGDPHAQYYPGRPDQYVNWVMLNPSTATDTEDDPTIRKCRAYAQGWGFGAMCVTNLFAYRDVSPERMKLQHDPVGPDNDQWLKAVAAEAGLIVCAWGNHGKHMHRGVKVRWLLEGRELHCLRVTGKSQPEHPLYLPGGLEPIPLPDLT